MQTVPAETPIYARPAALLQQLIRFDTSQPDGNEVACIAYIRDLLTAAGLAPQVLAGDPDHPNLVVRLPGRGEAPPLLLQGHVDVVTTAQQTWQHPPFGGEEHDGYIWGRGSLDMKGGVAMMIAAVLRAHAAGMRPPGDVILACLSDEESTGVHGAKFLVEQHPDLFEGVRYGLGEFGGFTLHMGGQRYYPVMVAEKQMCGLKVTLRGPGGHGALRHEGGAMAALGRVLTTLNRSRLPVHITPIMAEMIRGLAAGLPAPFAAGIQALLDPTQTDAVLATVGPTGAALDPMLHNTVNPTIVHGGTQVNVIPSAIELWLDGRVLPGYGPAAMVAEVGALLGPDAEIEVTLDETGAVTPNLALYPVLADILQAADPDGRPIPYLFPAVTDGRIFARLGIQTYGFLPMRLPPGFDFMATVHAADERVPVDAIAFGADAMYQALQRFGEARDQPS